MLNSKEVAIHAQNLFAAEQSCTPISPLTDSVASLSEEDAYAVQRAGVALRGGRPVGYKLGYTSAAMRQQMNIDHPNYGVLTDAMVIDEEGGSIPFGALIHPLVEPEIALVIGRDVTTPVASRAEMLCHVGAVSAALEIVDTRYTAYRFKAPDNIADNSSAARYVLGPPVPVSRAPDLRLIGVLLWSGGCVVDQGVGASALGDPLLAAMWLANRLLAEGKVLAAGETILTGGLTRAHAATRGASFVGEFASLGCVRASFG